MRELIIVGGATATGKSELACCLAKLVGGEIISADSMAIYRDMDIGTAKPLDCMREVRHHLIDVVDPGYIFDAKMFEERAMEVIDSLKSKGIVPIVAGGTYLYIQALLFGIDRTPEPNWSLRRKLYSLAERRGKSFLYERLRVIDPCYASKIHRNDLRRVVRALEVFIETGRAFSSFHRWNLPRYDYMGVHVIRDYESLSERIEKRVQLMIEKGLLEEVKSLVEKGFESFLTSSQAIGYKELVEYLKGDISLEEAIRLIIKHTKDYAKRQMRWFRKQGWIEVNLDKEDTEYACGRLAKHFLQAR